MAETFEANENDRAVDAVVIGAGAMGLASAYHLIKSGKSVVVLEAANTPGGMAAHFDFDGVSLERFYHFVCKTDFDTFELLDDLGLKGAIVWQETKMGYYTHGRLYPWGNPLALLTYPKLNFLDKCRYALMAWWCTKRKRWGKVEEMTAPDWFRRWLGASVYEKLWHRLFWLKFYEHTPDISASWIGTRIQRIGRSRKSLMKEQLGHIQGGTQTLVDALMQAIEVGGGSVLCRMPVQSVTMGESGLKRVVSADGRHWAAREVISTVPTPLIAGMFPELPKEHADALEAIENIGVVCLVFKLRRAVSGRFWVNILDEDHAIPGLIEFSALRDFGEDHIVYAPYYMPVTNERWSWSDDALLDEAWQTIRALNPELQETDVSARMASRLRYAQPICTPNFLNRLPPVDTDLPGVQIADTCFYYPEDRGISESVGLGKRMAQTALSRLGPGD